MLTLATWFLALTGAAGLGLACFYLLERPVRGWARLVSVAHGLAGAGGVALVLWLLVAGAADPQGFGRTACYLLGAALLGGAMVVAYQLRRRRAPGLLIVLHATLGMAGFVILLAYGSITR